MKQSTHPRQGFVLMALILILSLAGCSTAQAPSPEASMPPRGTGGNAPPLPAKITQFDQGVPVINVYVVAEKQVTSMPLEEYLYGVLAGEMKNDWPLEALKAQAILARTFVLRFMTEKESKYQGADVSTDIEEAQAYDAAGINDRIRQAVDDTRGMVLISEGTFPYTWFFAHSGGKTALAKEGLSYEKEEPSYTQVVDGRESDKAPEDAKSWEASFSQAQVIAAAKDAGLSLDTVESFAIGETGESGRAMTLMINGKPVDAPKFRVAIGSTEMRSTLLTKVAIQNGKVVMSGKGYGHGVGMSQWGAYGMADEGSTADQIVTYYFKNVTVEKLW
ncbi:MAG TPA: SpoIID/LytB domain-containing protein [Clostridia bacterium]|nr:SpoIID/LytB domain-containing protein [Clostridia bacterium]